MEEVLEGIVDEKNVEERAIVAVAESVSMSEADALSLYLRG